MKGWGWRADHSSGALNRTSMKEARPWPSPGCRPRDSVVEPPRHHPRCADRTARRPPWQTVGADDVQHHRCFEADGGGSSAGLVAGSSQIVRAGLDPAVWWSEQARPTARYMRAIVCAPATEKENGVGRGSGTVNHDPVHNDDEVGDAWIFIEERVCRRREADAGQRGRALDRLTHRPGLPWASPRSRCGCRPPAPHWVRSGTGARSVPTSRVERRRRVRGRLAPRSQSPRTPSRSVRARGRR